MATHTNAPGVLIYNGKPYAVGLLWFTVQEENAKELLQQRIRKAQADFYCQRMHISQQQAFGWLDKGHRRGMPVAAAMVADQLVGEWHGVFEADNGWWYVQVRSDTVTPNGDRFFVTEEEAFNVFQDEMAKHNWPHAYAPDKWRLGDRGIRELPLKNLLDDLVTTALVPANVTAVFGSTHVRNLVVGGLGVAALTMMGVVAYSMLSEPPPPPPIKRVPIAELLANQKTDDIIQIVAPQQLGQKCGEAADKLYQSLPGWQPQKFNCTNAAATMTWQQVTGALGEAKRLGSQRWPAAARITFLNRVLSVSVPLDKLPTIEQTDLMTQEEELLYLEQVLQPMGLLQVNPVIPAAPPAPEQTGFLNNQPPPPAPKPPPAYLSVSFNSGFAPEQVTPHLGLPGMEMTEAEWDIAQAMWQYKLKWYFQRPENVRAAPPAAARPQPGLPGTTAKAVGAVKAMNTLSQTTAETLPQAPSSVPAADASGNAGTPTNNATASAPAAQALTPVTPAPVPSSSPSSSSSSAVPAPAASELTTPAHQTGGSAP